MSSIARVRRQLVKTLPWLRQARSWLLRDPADMKRTFRSIYRNDHWGGVESISGPGSDLANTQRVQKIVGEMAQLVEARTLLDAPCGDLNWMREVDLGNTLYIGADLVPEMIARNRERFENEQRQFLVADITRSKLPEVDLILCRDCLVHLPLRLAQQAISNFRSSGRYLLTTTFPSVAENCEIATGGWRPLNLERPPFSLPAPIRCEIEQSDPEWETKSLALWRLDSP